MLPAWTRDCIVGNSRGNLQQNTTSRSQISEWFSFTPQKFNIDTKKWPYFKKESPFPRPIILDIHVSSTFGSGWHDLRWNQKLRVVFRSYQESVCSRKMPTWVGRIEDGPFCSDVKERKVNKKEQWSKAILSRWSIYTYWYDISCLKYRLGLAKLTIR